MKLIAPVYHSPILTEGTFENVFIEDRNFLLQRSNNYFTIIFDMYCIRESHKIILDSFIISFLGINSESTNSNRTTVISIPNPNYESEVLLIPTTVQISNPDYVFGEEGSEEFLTIPNPNYESMVTSIPLRTEVGMFRYIMYDNNGEMPTDYEIVDWGYPTYQDVLRNFDGGTLTNPELILNNDFAKGWFLNNVYMKGEKVGNQFNFTE